MTRKTHIEVQARLTGRHIQGGARGTLGTPHDPGIGQSAP